MRPELFVGVRHRLAGSFAVCLSPFAPPHSSLATSHLPPTSSFPIRKTHNATPQRNALTHDTRACRAARSRANKIRNHHRYFRLSISVLDKLMTPANLCAGGKVPGGRRGPPLAHPPQIETRFSHRSFHLHLRLRNISRPHDLRNFRRQLVALVYPERSERAAFLHTCSVALQTR